MLALVAGRLGRILPAVKTAIAYPLASKFRTGMTMAMISLVIFALTTMSAMNFNFDRVFLSDKARGGWDVEVVENPNNPIGDLRQALAGSEVDTYAVHQPRQPGSRQALRQRAPAGGTGRLLPSTW